MYTGIVMLITTSTVEIWKSFIRGISKVIGGSLNTVVTSMLAQILVEIRLLEMTYMDQAVYDESDVYWERYVYDVDILNGNIRAVLGWRVKHHHLLLRCD